MKPILTIIPTTGAPELRQAVESALPASDVLLVTDSDEGEDKTADVMRGLRTPWVDLEAMKRVDLPTLIYLHLPFRVGGGEWAGHRIYAAVPHLVNHEFVSFLDEDNWYEPTHLPAMLKALEHADVAWSYRRIHNRDGSYACDDTGESLGPFVKGAGGRLLVDTSCWAFRTEWLRKYCYLWDGAWGQDAAFTGAVRQLADGAAGLGHRPTRVAATGLHSACYRVGASERSPTVAGFLECNEHMRRKAARIKVLTV